MARVIIENLTKEQAETFVHWYEGQGEQDAEVWFDINDVETPYVDVNKAFKRDGDDITMFIRNS